MLGLALIASSATLAGYVPCTDSLVPCNYAGLFSGSIHQRIVTTVSAAADSSGKLQERVDEYDVTVVDGRATCTGKLDGKPIEGPGLIAVERGSTWYSILVACPDASGALPGIEDAQIKTDRQDDTAGFFKLESKLGDDSDAGGIATSKRADWSLVRGSGGRP
jgi:hypothetical protein